jgi:hypothetical protein
VTSRRAEEQSGRAPGYPELRDWLLTAGFAAVTGYGQDGRPLTADHKRMIIVADLAES